jgi:hypothetical protein
MRTLRIYTTQALAHVLGQLIVLDLSDNNLADEGISVLYELFLLAQQERECKEDRSPAGRKSKRGTEAGGEGERRGGGLRSLDVGGNPVESGGGGGDVLLQVPRALVA